MGTAGNIGICVRPPLPEWRLISFPHVLAARSVMILCSKPLNSSASIQSLCELSEIRRKNEDFNIKATLSEYLRMEERRKKVASKLSQNQGEIFKEQFWQVIIKQ